MPVFHEVADGGALYADPDDPQTFAARIASLDDKKKREELIKKGQVHIKKFSWDNSAKALLDAVKSL